MDQVQLFENMIQWSYPEKNIVLHEQRGILGRETGLPHFPFIPDVLADFLRENHQEWKASNIVTADPPPLHAHTHKNRAII
jgi:hypothetical protein